MNHNAIYRFGMQRFTFITGANPDLCMNGVLAEPGMVDVSDPDFPARFQEALDAYPVYVHVTALEIAGNIEMLRPFATWSDTELDRIVSAAGWALIQERLPLSDEQYDTFIALHEGAIIELGNRHRSQQQQDELPEFPQLEPRQSKSGYVYLLQSSIGYYKIGYTSNPTTRAATFAVKLPFDVEFMHFIKTNHMRRAEKQLHDKYAERRVNGEWFTLTEADIAEIKAIEYIEIEG